jgi:hypothetical protein
LAPPAVTLPDSERVLRGRQAAYTKWSRTEDRVAATAPARAAFMQRFEDEVDPERRLTTEERRIRAYYAMRAHMSRLARRRVETWKRDRG